MRLPALCRRWRERLGRGWPAWLAAALVLGLGWAQPRWHEPLDRWAFDALAPTLGPARSTVVVGIDDASLAALGRWPWPRELHARLLERLRQAGAAKVVFAVLFSEPADGAGDAAFAAALARMPGSVLAATPEGEVEADGLLEAPAIPLPALLAQARIGHARVPLDRDGVARRLAGPIPAPGGGTAWPALAEAPLAPDTTPAAARAVRLLPKPGRGPAALPQLSFLQALADPALAAQVRGRTVFVGVTAAGIDLPLATSAWQRDRPLSAVTLQAHAHETLRQGAQITPWPAAAQGLASLALVLLPLLAWRSDGRGLRHAGVVWPAALALPWLLGAAALAQQRWFGPSLPTLAIATALAAGLAAHHWSAQREHRRSRQKAQATLTAIGEAVIVLHANQVVDHMNRSAQVLARLPAGAGATLEQVFAFDAASLARLRSALGAAAATMDSVQLPEPLVIDTGAARRALRATLSPMRDRRGRPDGVVLALSDVTEALAAASRLAHAASHDTLTRLPNRTVLPERLQAALAAVPPAPAALLLLDLDRFRRINDSLGHHHGDQVLRITAARLRAACRPFDTVVRWGADEFVVLCPRLRDRAEAASIAESVVAALGREIDLDGLSVPGSCSLGVALAPDDGRDLDTLVAAADAAMVEAKAHPGTRWRFGGGTATRWTRDRLSLEADIRGALANGRFELHYQPQVATRTGRLVGFEALLRWRHDSGRLIMPAEFIGVAEESGLILGLGNWVLQEAVRVIAQWQADGGPQVPVAVNVSVRQCLDRSLVDCLRQLLATSAIPPQLLTLEITETAAMKDAAQVHALLSEIHALGVRLALDDFGTGYSSLAYLKRFPIDEIKIDRSFVRDLDADRDNLAIVRATIALAHSLGLPVVAEGVETEAQRRRLQQLRCDKIQGHLFAPALSERDAATWRWPLQAEPTQADLWMVDTGAFLVGSDAAPPAPPR